MTPSEANGAGYASNSPISPEMATVSSDIPQDGLAEVLRGWSGRGQLYEALAMIPDDYGELRWKRPDVQGRAQRVMLSHLEPLLAEWPTNTADWLHALPAESHRQRRTSDSPGAGTDWVETRMLGWAPEQFVINERSRIADQLMATTLRWTLDRVAEIRRGAMRVDRPTEKIAQRQIEAALKLRNEPPIDGAEAVRPARPDIRALRRSGRPWTRLAPVAEMIMRAQSEDLLTFARQHLMPDDDIRGCLFHLGVLGMILKSLRSRGAEIINLRPLSGAASPGPAYSIRMDNRQWDLWFQAGGIWKHYQKDSPYVTLTQPALGHKAIPLAPDILLIAPGEDAYAFECKHGTTRYIAHDGYLQAVAYGYELRAHHAKRVTSCAVGPDPKVRCDKWIVSNDVTIGVIGPRHIETMAF